RQGLPQAASPGSSRARYTRVVPPHPRRDAANWQHPRICRAHAPPRRGVGVATKVDGDRMQRVPGDMRGTLIAGTYRVTRPIAAGGIGAVWLGIDARSGQRVALKHLLPEAASNSELVARFEREAQVLACIRSNFVARRLDLVDDSEYGRVLVQEFIPGPPLSTILDQRRLSVDQAHALACGLLLGLVALERARIVHCDYKPGNIIMQPLLGGGQRPVLVDFGASRLLDGHCQALGDAPGATDRALGAVSDHLVVGTLAYMAPEQFVERAHLTCAVDLYALGAILFRALRGEHVFGRLQGRELVHAKVTREAPRLLGNRAGSAAQRLERGIARALRRRGGGRYQPARGMPGDLRAP